MKHDWSVIRPKVLAAIKSDKISVSEACRRVGVPPASYLYQFPTGKRAVLKKKEGAFKTFVSAEVAADAIEVKKGDVTICVRKGDAEGLKNVLTVLGALS